MDLFASVAKSSPRKDTFCFAVESFGFALLLKPLCDQGAHFLEGRRRKISRESLIGPNSPYERTPIFGGHWLGKLA